MLKIADYARRYEMEWYEVMRLCISDETTIQPIAILTHGELRVFELDDDELIGDFPGQDPIPVAYEECEMNPAFLARLIHAKFPVVFKPVTKNKEGLASDFYQLDDMPLRPPAVKKFQGMDRVWFAFNKIVSIGLENIWIPNEPAALIKNQPLQQKWKWQQLNKQLHIHSIFRISLKVINQNTNPGHYLKNWRYILKEQSWLNFQVLALFILKETERILNVLFVIH